jgi:hypothetical protein
MKAEGDCPECGATLGVSIDDGIASLMADSIRRMVDKDGNRMRCAICEEYVDPENVTVDGE